MIDKTKLKAEANSLGFALCGVTTPTPPEHYQAYHAWVSAGRHAKMAYLATERAKSMRAHPENLLPGCKSIIVLAASYPAPPANPSQNEAQIAAYAKSSDYHNVFPPRLEALADWITTQVGHPVAWRGFSDTAPILERELAQRAGLGWIGKNSSLINPRIGSFFMLAELFIDVFIEPDPPFEADHCGSCTKCIDACPTQCILDDHSIDASRCLSYLSIENKGSIPQELRPAMGTRIFGCDTCQIVCPWNREPAFDPGQTLFPMLQTLQGIDLADELEMDNATFRERFRHTPIARAKRGGYLRNVTVALGNLANHQTTPALAASLQNDPEPLVRAHAAWALGRIPGHETQTILQAALMTESNPAVLEEIQKGLLS